MRKALLRENNPIHQNDRTESVFDDYFSCTSYSSKLPIISRFEIY